MKFNKIYFFGIVFILVFIIIYTFSVEEKKDEYMEKLLESRVEKDHFFKDSDKSPIVNKQLFHKLEYYPPNQDFRIKAVLEFIKDSTAKSFSIKMTDGKTEDYVKFALATFVFKGETRKLLLLKPTLGDLNYIFIPFLDKTNAQTTYGGGRYLEIHDYKEGEKNILLDFNLAFNPFCAYNPNYSCPLPPKENRLDIAVEAGEKNFNKE